MKDIALRSDFPVNIDQQMTTAKALAQAGVLPKHLFRQPANIMAIGMASRALDIPTWTALQQVVPVDGKTTLQADLMRALILRAGHKFRVLEATPKQAVVVVISHDDPDYEHRVTVTYDEIPEELKKKANWKNYTADMLVARATAKVARRSCSDVLNGMIYTPDELGAEVDDDGDATSVLPSDSKAAQAAADAAERLRAAADREAHGIDAQQSNEDGTDASAPDAHTDSEVVDAEIVHEGDDRSEATGEQQPGDATAETDTTDEPEQFPESVGGPFGESTDDDLSEAANRPDVRVTALRKSLLAEAEKRWGDGYADAVKVACEGIPLEKVTNDELRELLFGKAS